EAFGHLYPAPDLSFYLQAAYGVEKTRRELGEAALAAWIVEADGAAVGHALAGPCALPHPAVTPACGELKRLYVLAPWRGGTGSALLAETLAWLEREGPRSLWIGVWSQNHAAQRLYARMGFEKVGEYEFAVGESRDHEFILRRGGA
ncbi:MAG: GNAT family N-acetyltransferase, partial [Caulobacteraceae bacterium]